MKTGWRRLAPILALAALSAVPIAGATASASLTADQIFAGELKGARDAARIAYKQLTPWSLSPAKTARAKAEITIVLKHLRKATQTGPSVVGGVSEQIDANLITATKLAAQASVELRKGNYVRARDNIEVAIGASQESLALFGVPLAREFAASVTYRELGNIEGWQEYMGLSAKVGAPVAKIVIGAAGRETANAGEPGGRKATPPLQITKLAIYTLQAPSGSYSSGWGKVVNGVIVCDLKPIMAENETFAISFQPRVPKGTEFLVKFVSTDGKRSYAILKTK